MDSKHTRALAPRKTPRQARSTVTVDAVFEAAIQVLLSEGAQRLTTTRVAERAGVSVGTLYQYYPNKQALLYAVMQRHLGHVAEIVEEACSRHHHTPLSTMVQGLVHAFVAAKTARVDEARALYRVAAELNAVELVLEVSERMRRATSAMLATATDASFEDLPTVTFMLNSAIVGPTRAVLEGHAPAKMIRVLREQLITLCDAYLKRVAIPVTARNEKARKIA